MCIVLSLAPVNMCMYMSKCTIIKAPYHCKLQSARASPFHVQSHWKLWQILFIIYFYLQGEFSSGHSVKELIYFLNPDIKSTFNAVCNNYCIPLAILIGTTILRPSFVHPKTFLMQADC